MACTLFQTWRNVSDLVWFIVDQWLLGYVHRQVGDQGDDFKEPLQEGIGNGTRQSQQSSALAPDTPLGLYWLRTSRTVETVPGKASSVSVMTVLFRYVTALQFLQLKAEVPLVMILLRFLRKVLKMRLLVSFLLGLGK